MKFFYNATGNRNYSGDVRNYIRQCEEDQKGLREALRILGGCYFKNPEVKEAEKAVKACIDTMKKWIKEAETELKSIK